MSTTSEYTAHTYTDAAGVVIEVLCPWGPQSGNVPPPTISFGDRVFVYTRSEDA